MDLSSQDIQSAEMYFETKTNKLVLHLTKHNDTTIILEIKNPKESILNTMTNLLKMCTNSVISNREQYSTNQLFENQLSDEDYHQALQLEDLNQIINTEYNDENISVKTFDPVSSDNVIEMNSRQ